MLRITAWENTQQASNWADNTEEIGSRMHGCRGQRVNKSWPVGCDVCPALDTVCHAASRFPQQPSRTVTQTGRQAFFTS